MKKKIKNQSIWKKSDRHQKREASLYENPIPSREFLMEYIAEQSRFMTLGKLAKALNLVGDAEEGLRRRLNAMERDGQLIRNRREGFGPVDKVDLVKGRVIGHPDGYGFVVPEDGTEDLFLSARQMRQLIHGDKGLFRISGLDHRGRREGAMVQVLERNTDQIVGRYMEENGIGVVVPDSQRIQHDVLIPAHARNNARVGQIVVAKLIDQPSKRSRPSGEIVEILGDHMGPGMEIDIAIRSHNIPYEWPAGVENEITQFGSEVSSSLMKNREDLREIPLVTIDGADAKDFDDAVYCRRTKKGWKLLVAIADVSAYVKPGTALDEEALARATSVYFPGRVVPMLPEVLSNGLCSINPHVNRLCMACEMLIDERGQITRARFMEGVMRSHARLTYDEVWGMLEGSDKEALKKHAAQLNDLRELYSLYEVLKNARNKRGTIDFETTETTIIFGRDQKIERIEPLQRNDAHKLIEECMVAANVAAARFLSRKKIPALYRVHDSPPVEKLTNLKQFLAELGLKMSGGESPEPADFARLLKSVSSRPDAHLIQTVLLRSMSQAQYTPDNEGHFGLSLEHYAHFTSPIRRYPDLLVHRAIKHLLLEGKAKGYRYSYADMQSLGEHCSLCERRADEATRDAVSWLKCEYIEDKVGDTFAGTITAVTSFGLFVELDGIYVEGLVHVTSLKNDYYHFEPAQHRLIGERTKTSYRLGDQLKVRVIRVNLDERKIDFDMGESSEKQPVKKKSKRKKDRKRRSKRGS